MVLWVCLSLLLLTKLFRSILVITATSSGLRRKPGPRRQRRSVNASGLVPFLPSHPSLHLPFCRFHAQKTRVLFVSRCLFVNSTLSKTPTTLTCHKSTRLKIWTSENLKKSQFLEQWGSLLQRDLRYASSLLEHSAHCYPSSVSNIRSREHRWTKLCGTDWESVTCISNVREN
jgi:hypothetical protein